jgi:hypothetical protein
MKQQFTKLKIFLLTQSKWKVKGRSEITSRRSELKGSKDACAQCLEGPNSRLDEILEKGRETKTLDLIIGKENQFN